MKLKRFIGRQFCLIGLTFLCSFQAYAEVTVENAWLRLLPPMSKMTAGYMKLTSDQEDRLLSVSSDMASKIEIHHSKMEDGLMSMQEVSSLQLPKGEAVELKPQSYHLMVMGLNKPLTEGAIHTLTLTFERAGQLDIQVPVLNP